MFDDAADYHILEQRMGVYCVNALFAETLRKLRTEKGISQSQLGKQLFVNHSTVARWENGSRLPDASMIPRLADSLGVAHADAYAVGDGSNDVDMLRDAALGFVPVNGEPLALAAADRIVRSNDEGAVAHVIELLDSMY